MHDHVNCEHHKPPNFGAAFAVGILLNGGFVLAEVIYGFVGHSLSLLADAGHNLGDVLGLLMAWVAASLANKPPTTSLTYGYRRTSILAAMANSGMLLVAVGAIIVEAVAHLIHPAVADSTTVMAIAAIGIVTNGGTALMFARGRKGELNVRGAYLHMLADALVAAGVVVAGYLIRVTHSPWIDPVAAILIAALIARASWSVLRESAELAMDGVPRNIDPNQVKKYLEALPGVETVSDLHIWAMSTSDTALTAHLVAPNGFEEAKLHDIEHDIFHEFAISHCTIQIDRTSCSGCSLAV